MGISQATIYINVPEDSPMNSGGIVGELFLPVDGDINEEIRQKCLDKFPDLCKNAVRDKLISIDELTYIIQLVDTQKTLTDIELEKLVDIKEIKKLKK